MHAVRWTLLLALVAPVLLAGCTGPRDAEATSPTQSSPPNFRAPAGFVLDGPAILPADGTERALREDDGALVRYVLLQPSSATESATALVSYILEGEVLDVQSVTLAPGQSKSFEWKIDEVRGMGTVDVEVRAGTATGRASSPVEGWPRPKEALVMGEHFQATVDTWGVDPLTNETVVNVTMTRGVKEFAEFRSYLLCLGADGAPARAGVQRPELQPDPNGVETFEMRFPACPTQAYGVEIKADVEGGKNIMGRVLFVPKGWAPPAAA